MRRDRIRLGQEYLKYQADMALVTGQSLAVGMASAALLASQIALNYGGYNETSRSDGGKTYEELKKGTSYYNNAVATGASIIAVVHGEADATAETGYAQYLADLLEWRSDYATDLGRPNIAMVHTQVSSKHQTDGLTERVSEIALAQLQAGVDDARSFCAGPKYQYYYQQSSPIATIVGADGTITVTTTAYHHFSAGDPVEITGTVGFNGDAYTVASVVSETVFTITSATTGSEATGNVRYYPATAIGLHLTDDGYKWLAQVYGEVLTQILNGVAWKPLQPATVARVGAVITVTFDIPGTALVLDTSRVPEQTNYGFVYHDDTDSAAIQSVTVNATTVEITLDGVPDGANPKLRYAWDYTGAPTANSGGRYGLGNIKDNSSWTWASGDYPDGHWLVHFEMAVSS